MKYNTDSLNITKEAIKHFQEEIKIAKSGEWEESSKEINRAAKTVFGTTKMKKKIWWNESCEEAVAERTKQWNKWKCSGKTEHLDEFKIQRKETARIIKSAKRSFEKSQLLDIQNSFVKNNSRNFYQMFKSHLKGYQAPNICFTDENGKVGLSNNQNCEILRKYFEQLLNCEEPNCKLEFPDLHENTEADPPPTAEEIKKAINTLKNNKASGEDCITAELIKWSQPKIVTNLQLMFEEIWKTEKIPEDWKVALIHPLHKKGDKQNVNNYRGISLLPVGYKIFSTILLNKVEATLDGHLGEYQSGFRKGRSCSEQIFNLKSIIRHRLTNSKDIVVTFIDFKKAFDSVDRETLDKVIREFGIKSKLANLIRETLTDTKSKVKFRGEISTAFKIKTGVRQGDGLSPLLFNCVLEKIVREWKQKLKEQELSPIRLGTKKKGIEIHCLAFADDFAILSENLTNAGIQINLLEEVANKAGLRISVEKTKFMTNIKNAPESLATDIGQIKRVNKFKYLGEIIQENGLEKLAVEERVHKMERAYGITRNIYNKRCLSKNLKIQHYNTVVKPECLYASECLVLNYKLQKLEVLERKIIRKILGPQKNTEVWKLRSNEEVYRNIENITETLRKRRLLFFGHLYRMNNNRLTKQIFKYLWDKKSTIAWIQEVKKDLERNNISEKDATEREIFKRKVLKMEGFQGRKEKKTGSKWTEERKRAHSEKMKEYWRKKKEQQRKKH